MRYNDKFKMLKENCSMELKKILISLRNSSKIYESLLINFVHAVCESSLSLR